MNKHQQSFPPAYCEVCKEWYIVEGDAACPTCTKKDGSPLRTSTTEELQKLREVVESLEKKCDGVNS